MHFLLLLVTLAAKSHAMRDRFEQLEQIPRLDHARRCNARL